MPLVFHIVLDQKFTDNAIDIFDRLSGIESRFLCVSRSGSLSHIKNQDRVILFKSQIARLAYIRRNSSDVIIIHSLFFGATMVPLVSGRIPLVWITWGQDIYRDEMEPFASTYPFRHSLFMPETRSWRLSGRRGLRSRAAGLLKAFVRNAFRAFAIRKVRAVSTCLPYEYPLIKKTFPHLARFDFDYIDETAPGLSRCDGRNILIGNSASINCNHLDVLKTLYERGTEGRKIIVPLSYAGGESYINTVIQAGTQAFGEDFMPLRDYMEIGEYTKLIRSCGFAVMGFLRQQATKNLQLLFCQGTKIFFYKDTDLFRYFKDAGYAVFSIEEDLNAEGLGSLLSDSEVKKNRLLALAQFDFQANLENTSESLERILAGRN